MNRINATRILTFLCAAFLSLSANFSHAEIIQGINYADSLGKVKEIFPNAKFEKILSAWVQKDETFYSVSGLGMVGSLRILFNDARPHYKKRLLENAENVDFDKSGLYKRLSIASDDDALWVAGVRWIPIQAIPIARYRQKYGPPKCSFDEEMNPICRWASVAIEANMSDDNKMVNAITTSFTKAEQEKFYK